MRKPSAEILEGLQEVHSLAEADVSEDDQEDGRYPLDHPVHKALEWLKVLAYSQPASKKGRGQ